MKYYRTTGAGRGKRGEGNAHALPSAIHHSSFIIHHSSSGFTLIEMLIVVSIMMILVAAGASVFRPAGDSRRTREAARAINVYLSSARNRAMETGRPCGVILRCISFTDPSAMTLDQCEVPPSFAGDLTTSVVRVQDWTTDPNNNLGYWFNIFTTLRDGSTVLKLLVRDGDIPPRMVHDGDLVQLNNQGPCYSVVVADPYDDAIPSVPCRDFPVMGTGTDPTSINFHPSDTTLDATNTWVTNYYLTLRLEPTYTQPTPWLKRPAAAGAILTTFDTATPVPFRIFRSPIKSAVTPLQLPAASVIDIAWSGFSSNLRFTPDPLPANNDVCILFAPNGAVDRVYSPKYVGPATSPILLLVGKHERVTNAPQFPPTSANESTWANWQDMNNLWIVINPQTGLVTTGEVADSAAAYAAAIAAGKNADDAKKAAFDAACSLARDAQSMGGR